MRTPVWMAAGEVVVLSASIRARTRQNEHGERTVSSSVAVVVQRTMVPHVLLDAIDSTSLPSDAGGAARGEGEGDLLQTMSLRRPVLATRILYRWRRGAEECDVVSRQLT
jgi:hypothetical protein